MKMYGVTLDFNDMRSCGILPDMCLEWDHKSEELSENKKLLSYWDEHVESLLKETKKVVIGNMENKSVLFSADEKAINLIKKHFPEIELTTAEYEEIINCDHCIKHDYLNL